MRPTRCSRTAGFHGSSCAWRGRRTSPSIPGAVSARSRSDVRRADHADAARSLRCPASLSPCRKGLEDDDILGTARPQRDAVLDPELRRTLHPAILAAVAGARELAGRAPPLAATLDTNHSAALSA